MFGKAASGSDARIAGALRSHVVPLGEHFGYEDAILDVVGDARIVLLGEATHGTHDFYATRRRITQRLVQDRGFTIVSAEADWPDAARVHRYVQGRSDDPDPRSSLEDFQRFPSWMWRNADVVALVGWMHEHNKTAADKIGFYGLDLYSMHSSIHAVLAYLEAVDPEGVARAREAYSCILRYGSDPQTYGQMAGFGLAKHCEAAVFEQLVALQEARDRYVPGDEEGGIEEHFFAERNAALVADAEEYYRTMFTGRTSTWNLRDGHMVDTLDALLDFVTERQGRPAKAVVWAHNSHVGDARHTEPGRHGEHNIGQLCRQRHPGEVVNIGFTTSTGTVTAASDWGGQHETKRVRPPMDGSWEQLFQAVGEPKWLLDLRKPDVRELLKDERIERAIGVIYRPESERQSHYFKARIADQFDAVIHMEETRAVEPLDDTERMPVGDAPDTFPTGE